ncbi:helix-turn-helix domain-containing protein [Dactylosporangium sp. NPDC005555]|uniref:TetR/AcrR family transcriptional regulator n=1 Tax=Dactylosporangium sp. NPDC005555 TaxID=3154889 RepID=UPI0033AB6B2A
MEQNQTAARVVRGRNRIRTADAGSDDVRSHIQRVALELFIEEGYDKTSLREIAEKLGVTKAALYYHFPTKDDIVNSLIEHRIAAVDALMEWAEAQPRDEPTRMEFVRRYSVLHDVAKHEHVIRFFERNQTLINTLPAGKLMKGQMERVFAFIMDPSESTVQQMRRAMAIFTIHAGHFVLRGRDDLTPQERRDATLVVAEDLMRQAAAAAASE